MTRRITSRNLPDKTSRHRAILELVRSGVVRTQDDLLQGLRRRRIGATQATVSRDVRELGLVRTPDNGRMRYQLPVAELDMRRAGQRLGDALRDHALTLEFVDLLGVVHTAPGSAPLVAAALDGVRFEEIAGTIAGDDTILVVTRSRPAAQRLLLRLRSMMDEQ